MRAQEQQQEYSSIAQRKGSIRTEDGVQISWQAIGHGPPIICCNGVGVSTFFWKYICQYFGSQYTIILWDYRGHGESQRNFTHGMPDLSIERHVKDLQQVCTHLLPETSPAILLGHSMGCQVCIEFQRTHPQLVKLKEKQTRNGLRLLLVFDKVTTVDKALKFLEPFTPQTKNVSV